VANASRAPAPRRPRARRTQAERTAATRERILAAVVESIAEVGIQRTTASEIARRAGVTWGAVQHHFGAKNGILEAVLAESVARLAERTSSIPADAPLASRVGLFVEKAWEHFSSAHYRSMLEILLHLAPADREGAPGSREGMERAFDAIWRRVFPDASLPKPHALALQRYTSCVLSGLASLAALDGRGTTRARELRLLEDTLRRELAGGGERQALEPTGTARPTPA
jgi:AcrR family transcriptional regulator